VFLSGLRPSTRYYYAVCNDTVCADYNSNLTFVTTPGYGEDGALRVLALGDVGNGNKGFALDVIAGAYRWMSQNGGIADVWWMLGDDAYKYGTDNEYSSNTLQYLRAYLASVALWTTLGNHDISSNSDGQTGPYFSLFKPHISSSTPSGTGAYYSYDHGTVHVVCMDSEYSSRSKGSPMLTWLANDLAAIDRRKTKWLVAFWHHPVYTKGSHDSDKENNCVTMRTNALPLLEAAGLDLLVTGHSHMYERSWFVNRQYDLSSTFDADTHVSQPGYGGGVHGGEPYVKPAGLFPHNGFVTITAGASSLLEVNRHGLKHPVMVPFQELNGMISLMSVVIDVTATRLNATALYANGTAADSFVIVKG
jgi:acid phosphatase type 7